MTGPGSGALRPLTPADLDAIEALVPPGWRNFRPTFEFYFTRPCCHPWGLEVGGRLAAMGTRIEFGATAWIAQLITAPEVRGRGLGSTVLQGLLDGGRARGIRTFSLTATALGYPLYAKAGFEVEGWMEFWTRAPGAALAPEEPRTLPGRPLTPADLGAVARWDAEVTGEDRRPFWEPLTEGGRIVDGPGEPAGLWLPRFGEGLVLARSPEAGLPLIEARLAGATQLVVPEASALPRPLLEARGFAVTERARRMVLGPRLDRRPDQLWSRVGGNLG